MQGVPQLHRSCSVDLVLPALLADAAVQQLLQVPAELTPHHALRVSITPYPEGLFAVWVMAAVKHRT